MAEYIERNSLIIDIQSRKLADIVPNCDEPIISDAVYKQGQAIKKIITEFPTADVVEVVRCKDCKHKVLTKGNRVMCSKNAQKMECVADWYGLTATDDNNFCSYGEKRSKDK